MTRNTTAKKTVLLGAILSSLLAVNAWAQPAEGQPTGNESTQPAAGSGPSGSTGSGGTTLAPARPASDATPSSNTAQPARPEPGSGSTTGRQTTSGQTTSGQNAAASSGKTARPEADSRPAGTARPAASTKPGAAAATTKGKSAQKGGASATVKKAVKPKPKKRTQGWFPRLKVGLNMSLVHNKNVPGIDDGLTFTMGLLVGGNLKYIHGGHGWITNLTLVEGLSKTPNVDPILKTADELDLSTAYRYEFKRLKSLNVFAMLELVTPVAPGDLVPKDDQALLLHDTDGNDRTDSARHDMRYRLTPAFSPLTFKQLVGTGIKPTSDPFAMMNVKLSLVTQEVWASGYTINDDKDTPELDLTQLENYQQAGVQLNAEIKGTFKKRLNYAFAAEFMFPFYTSIDTDLSGFDLLNANISFKVGVKVASWASVDYVFSAKRIPLLVRQWQVLNNLVLTLTANIL
ncbi:MAG: hypothetical protein J7M25_18490 [Deltaproteobacteria bacterium]|nr:hypothetical protein [Deltaproteobacteria bacterium]